MTAVDLDKGTIKWSVPLGTLDKLMPVAMPLALGAPGIGGPIVTAGGLIFIGATADEKFRAFDLDTGEELWKAEHTDFGDGDADDLYGRWPSVHRSFGRRSSRLLSAESQRLCVGVRFANRRATVIE